LKSRGRVTAPKLVGEFRQALPQSALDVVEALADNTPDVDPAATLAQVSDSELLALLAPLNPSEAAALLQAIGVTARGGRPRQPALMKAKLSAGLRGNNPRAVHLAHVLLDNIYMLLLVRGAGLADEVKPEEYNARIDTVALRAMSLTIQIWLPDPSFPIALAGMAEVDDPALELIFDRGQRTDLVSAAARFRAGFDDEWLPALQAWTRRRTGLGGSVTEASVQAAEPGNRTPQAGEGPADQVTDATAPARRAAVLPAQTSGDAVEVGLHVVTLPAVPEVAIQGDREERDTAPPDEPATVVATLADCRLAALPASGRLLDTVTAGRRPGSHDLQAIEDYLAAFDAACHTVGGEPQTATVDELTDAHSARTGIRDHLLELTSVQGAGPLAGPLAALSDHANRLIIAGNFDPTNGEIAALVELRALVIAAAAGGHDDDDLLERATALKQQLPEQLGRLAAAAGFGRLSLVAGRVEAENPTNDAPAAAGLPPNVSTPASSAGVSPVQRDSALDAAPTPVVVLERGIAASPVLGPTPSDPSTPNDLTPDEPVLDPPVVQAVNELLTSGRFGLAYHLLSAAGATAHADAVCLAALAAAAQTASGPCALELLEMLEALDSSDELHLAPDIDTALINAAALTQTVITTGNTHAAQLLAGIVDLLDPAWSQLGRLASDAGGSGALTAAGALPLTTIQVEQARTATREAAATAQRRHGQTFHLRTPRATSLLGELRSGQEPFGASLSAAANNDVSQADQARRLLSPLTRNSIGCLIAEADRRSRGSGRGLSADDRREIHAALAADRTAVLRWVEVASAGAGNESQHDWSAGRLSELREHIVDSDDELRGELDTYASGGEVASGAAALAGRALDRMQTLVFGQIDRSWPEPTPNALLNLELLKIDAAEWDPTAGKVNLAPEHHTVAALLTSASETDYLPATQRRIAGDDYPAAFRCAREVGEGEEGLVQTAQDERVADLRDRLAEQRLVLVRARSAEAGMVKQDMLDAQLSQAELMLHASAPNVAAAAQSLDEASAEMATLRGHAAVALQQRLDKQRREGTLPEAPYKRLLGCLDKDNFDQVEYELSFIENGDEIPRDVSSEIAAFYPQVVEALASGLTHDDVNALAAGQTVAGIAWELSDEQRGRAGKTLHDWIEMPRAALSPFDFEATRDALAPVLSLLGLEVGPYGIARVEADGAWGKGRRLLDVQARPKVRSQNATQGAVIPAFGSLAEGRYRVLLAWEKPSVEDLNDWRELDATLGPLIIFYFGTLPAEHRLRLAREWHDSARRPTIVIDDAVLATVAASREPFSTTMALTMPFSSAAPFSSEKTPKVPVEMFYGREGIIRDVIRADGPSLLYGGRGMGKSALLSVIQRRARANPAENLTVVWVELARSAEFDEPEVVWSKLLQGLEAEGVISTARGVAAIRSTSNRVERIVKDWLTANPGSRLLLLIDEADAFFAADARREFKETSTLLALANQNNRCKVVFAGLHGVAHHHGVGNNPFSPSGALPIGPLELSDSHRLLTRPMQALGYELDPNDASVILMYCNNQPYLIQLFATQLLKRLLRGRPRSAPELPWHIPNSLVDEVTNDRGLQDQIRTAFKITLDLDQRFGAIIYLIGMHAFDHGQRPLAESELFDLCRSSWPNGFAQTTPTAFRELLKELEALGILGEAEALRGGRMLRSSAVLRSLGASREAIETSLREVQEKALPEVDARLQFRPSIGNADGRPGPLTSAQLADIAGRRGNRVRIVVGSVLTGVDQVADSLKDPVHKPVLRDVRLTDGQSDYAALLRTGADGEKRLTVVSPLFTLTSRSNTCETALQKARELLPDEPGHTRAVALVAGPGNIDWLLEVASRGDCDGLIVPLELMNKRSLPLHWRDVSSKLTPLGGGLSERTLTVTGGWPKLIDQVSVRGRRAGAAAALDELEAEQQLPVWPGRLLADAGVLANPNDQDGTGGGVFLRLLRVFAELGGYCGSEDLLEFGAADGISEPVLAVAQWFGLLGLDEDGLLRPGPLLGDAFKNWTASTVG